MAPSLKRSVFGAYERLIENVSNKIELELLLAIIQLAQLLALVWDEDIFQINESSTDTFRALLEYFSLLFDVAPEDADSCFISLGYTIVLLLFTGWVFFGSFQDKERNSTIGKVAALLLRLATEIGFIPALHFFATALRGIGLPSDWSSWSGASLLLNCAIMLFGSLMVLHCLMGALCVFDANAASPDPHAKVHGRAAFGHLVACAVVVVSYHMDSASAHLIAAICASLASLYLSLRSLPYYNVSMNRLVVIRNSLFVWGAVTVAVAHLNDDRSKESGAGLLLLLCGAPVVAVLAVLAVDARLLRAAKADAAQMRSAFDVELYSRLKLKELPLSTTSPEQRAAILDEVEESLLAAIKRSPSPLLYIVTARFFTDHRHNYHKAAKQLRDATLSSPPVDIAFFCHVQHRRLLMAVSNSLSMDAETRVVLEQAIKSAQEASIKALDSQRQFWLTCMGRVPNLTTMYEKARDVLINTASAEESFELMSKTSPQNPFVLRTYAAFVTDIMGDDRRGQEMVYLAERLEERQAEGYSVAFDAVMEDVPGADNDGVALMDDRNAILTVSADSASFGEIHSANASLSQLFGYQSGFVMGNNFFTLLLPPVVGQEVSNNLQTYLETGSSSLVNSTRTLFGVHRHGQLIPIFMTTYSFVMTEKPTFVFVIKKLENSDSEYLLLDEDRRVLGATEAGLGMLNATNAQLQHSMITADQFMPSLEEKLSGFMLKPLQDDDPALFVSRIPPLECGFLVKHGTETDLHLRASCTTLNEDKRVLLLTMDGHEIGGEEDAASMDCEHDSVQDDSHILSVPMGSKRVLDDSSEGEEEEKDTDGAARVRFMLNEDEAHDEAEVVVNPLNEASGRGELPRVDSATEKDEAFEKGSQSHNSSTGKSSQSVVRRSRQVIRGIKDKSVRLMHIVIIFSCLLSLILAGYLIVESDNNLVLFETFIDMIDEAGDREVGYVEVLKSMQLVADIRAGRYPPDRLEYHLEEILRQANEAEKSQTFLYHVTMENNLDDIHADDVAKIHELKEYNHEGEMIGTTILNYHEVITRVISEGRVFVETPAAEQTLTHPSLLFLWHNRKLINDLGLKFTELYEYGTDHVFNDFQDTNELSYYAILVVFAVLTLFVFLPILWRVEHKKYAALKCFLSLGYAELETINEQTEQKLQARTEEELEMAGSSGKGRGKDGTKIKFTRSSKYTWVSIAKFFFCILVMVGVFTQIYSSLVSFTDEVKFHTGEQSCIAQRASLYSQTALFVIMAYDSVGNASVSSAAMARHTMEEVLSWQHQILYGNLTRDLRGGIGRNAARDKVQFESMCHIVEEEDCAEAHRGVIDQGVHASLFEYAKRLEELVQTREHIGFNVTTAGVVEGSDLDLLLDMSDRFIMKGIDIAQDYVFEDAIAFSDDTITSLTVIGVLFSVALVLLYLLILRPLVQRMNQDVAVVLWMLLMIPSDALKHNSAVQEKVRQLQTELMG